MSQKLHVYDFKWVEDISEFDKSFINNYNEEIDQGYFLEVDIQYPENLFNLHNDLPLLSERMKTEKLEKLMLAYIIKLNVVLTKEISCKL